MSKTMQLGIGFHQGNTIMETARTYPSVLKVALEVAQNSIDVNAKTIVFEINLKKRMFSLSDDGKGCGFDKFKEALQSINRTLKVPGKYGQFGRGLVSPLAVSDEFTFTSSNGHEPYNTYTFNRAKIASQTVVSIPGVVRGDLHYGKNGVWWKTQVCASGLTKDRQMSNTSLNELLSEIALRFGQAIRERKIDITVTFTNQDGEKSEGKVVAPEFSGEPIDSDDIKEATVAGLMQFKLFISRVTKTGRKGKVLFGTTGNPSRITVDQFATCASGLIEREVIQGLVSGDFEGEILCENIRLNPDRVRFENNDALAELCIWIEEWWKNIGKAIAEELRSNDVHERYQKTGVRIMPFAALLLRQQNLRSVASLIKVGTVGAGHAPAGNVIGDDPHGTAISTPNKPTAHTDKGGEGGSNHGPGIKDHGNHKPGPVYGPRGRNRTEVRDHSTGLRFAFEAMLDIKVPFTYDARTGTLTFNIDHPDWAACESDNNWLEQYQLSMLNTALHLELVRHEGMIPDIVMEFAYMELHGKVFAILNSEAMLGAELKKA